MTEFTDAEKRTMRDAAMGAVLLVSKAEPGMIDTVKESFAASKSFATASGDLQGVFKGFSMPKFPKGGTQEMESGVLSQLSASVATLQAKSPGDVDAYRHIVVEACTNAAEAAKGVSAAESAALTKVESALSASA